MKLPLHIANQLLQLRAGEKLPASSCKGAIYKKMIDDGALRQQQVGRSKALIIVPDNKKLDVYLLNQFAIPDLSAYIQHLQSGDRLRADAVKVAGDSKLKKVRTFKGFMVNSYMRVYGHLDGKEFRIQPAPGSFCFIYDHEKFMPDENVTVIGVENPENFRWIERQQYLFKGMTPLFVSRYPQSKDLVRWLQTIPNSYLHFGDFDFEGISIFLDEIHRHLPERASMFIPENIESLLQAHGNRKLYNKQVELFKRTVDATELEALIALFHKYHKVLEQEILIENS